MSRWSRIVRNYFTFNNRERRSLYALLVVLSVLSIVHLILRFSPSANIDVQQIELQRIEDFEQRVAEQNQSHQDHSDKRINFDEIEWSLFDPNEIDASELASLGLDSILAFRIVNYRNKGGLFYDVDDVAKIYGLPPEWLAEAEGYMTFPEPKTKFDKKEFANRSFADSTYKRTRSEIEVVELNTADSVALVQIPWIGPFYAKEIVKLRQRLGGYKSYDQLLDIYMMKDEAIESLMKYSTLDTNLATGFNINTCSVEDLGRHPFLSWKEARVIINYRQQHGPYESVKGILKTRMISDSVYTKIAPYLRVQ
ncbi:MAG: helix-hairpin-helix domain-containing protein [Flavobacteriales bacterium]